MNILKGFSLVVGLGLAHTAAPAGSGLNADLGKDFSLTRGNPNRAWTYGTMSAVGKFTAFPAKEIDPDDLSQPVEVWLDPNTASAIFHNANHVNVISNGGAGVHPPNSVWFGSISPDALTVARYTAHDAGKVALRVSFKLTTPSFQNEADIHVLVNGVEVFADVLDATHISAGFQTGLKLKRGDIVDFAAGNGGDGAWGDSVFVDAEMHKK